MTNSVADCRPACREDEYLSVDKVKRALRKAGEQGGVGFGEGAYRVMSERMYNALMRWLQARSDAGKLQYINC